MRRQSRERQGKREDRTILKRLRATLLRLFRGCTAKMVCVRGVLGVNGALGKANSHFNPNGVGDRITTLRRLLIGAIQFFSLYMYILYIYDRNFSLHYPKKSESIRVLGTDRKSVIMVRVKVYSKSELVEDREGKSELYGVICCCDDRLLSRAVISGHTV